MAKSLLNLLVQISNVCQKSEFQIKFEKVLFLEFGPAQVFSPAARALAFGRPAPPPLLLGLAPLPARPSPSLSDVQPPRSPSNPIKGCLGIRSSPVPPSPLSTPRASLSRALLHSYLRRCHAAAFRAPVSLESGPPCFPLPPMPLGRSSRASERAEAELRRARTRGNGHQSMVDQAGVVHRSVDLVHGFFFNKIIPRKSHFPALCT
jgi:hypothetical protein